MSMENFSALSFSCALDRIAAHFPHWAEARAARVRETAPARALGLFAAAADAGHRLAAFAVGECYLNGTGAMRDLFEAARWFRRAAEAGHLAAQCRLAQLHLLGLPGAALARKTELFAKLELQDADYHAATIWARQAAEAGAADAQAMLGYILSSGPVALRDPEAAVEWYRKSSEQNCAQGRLGLGINLMAQADTPEKISAARYELSRAAEAGLPTAHYLLAADTALDETQARQHYRMAAEAGLINAQTKLGQFLLAGKGGPADALNGESWLRRAALAGDCEAAVLLGRMYAGEGGFPANEVEAERWLSMAADRGHRGAAVMLAQRP